MNKTVMVYRDRKNLDVRAQQEISEPPRKMSLDQVIGIMRIDSVPPPNDEECRKIIEEERWRKYG